MGPRRSCQVKKSCPCLRSNPRLPAGSQVKREASNIEGCNFACCWCLGVRLVCANKGSARKRERKRQAGDWRKLHNEQQHYACCSRNITQKKKARDMRRAGHVAFRGKKGEAYRKGMEGNYP